MRTFGSNVVVKVVLAFAISVAVFTLMSRSPTQVWSSALGLSLGMLIVGSLQWALRRHQAKAPSEVRRNRSIVAWVSAGALLGAAIMVVNGVMSGEAAAWSMVDWGGVLLSGAGVAGLGAFLIVGLANALRL